MVNKKLTPIAKPASEKKNDQTSNEPTSIEVQMKILEELKKQSEYLHALDWKIWMLMNMIKIIGEDNGYKF